MVHIVHKQALCALLTTRKLHIHTLRKGLEAKLRDGLSKRCLQ